MKGKILVLTGDGKGKTTAAIGTAIRATGHGKRVIIVQFLKKGEYGEIKALRNAGVEVYQFGSGEFVFQPTDEDFRRAEEAVNFALEKMMENPFLLILDEINVALSIGVVKLEDIIELLDARGETHIILTGRNAPPEILQKADLVTEMKNIRHYYDKGEKAIEGLEY
ncbi:MAG TPA: cob(I)yrinic acid a,c-diamide adenosyltransferase [Thermoplasmatales archaeon]|nr:cob(I)yrinic acid a,c-diamide adenosyltransferase [Thermoplasmatales archaeon]